MTDDENLKFWLPRGQWRLLNDPAALCRSPAFWRGFAHGLSPQYYFFTDTDHIWTAIHDFDSVGAAWKSVGDAWQIALDDADEQIQALIETQDLEQSAEETEATGAATEGVAEPHQDCAHAE